MSIIRLRSISKLQGRTPHKIMSLMDINLNIEAGDFISIMGPSGCGKSTLLRILGGIDRASNGEYIFEGKNITRASAREVDHFRNEDIACIFQELPLSENLSVWKNINLTNKIKMSRSFVRNEVLIRYMDILGIRSIADKKVALISQEQKQNVAIVCALAKGAKVILVDDPRKDLDKKNGFKVMNTLRILNREFRITIIVVTKDLIIANMADKIIRMTNGMVMEIQRVH